MSIGSIRPGLNDNYAHYLIGLGLGIILGAMFGYNSLTFPKFLIGGGFIFVVLGAVISTRVLKNGKK